MALRLVELVIPVSQDKDCQDLVDKHQVLGVWRDRLHDDRVVLRVLLMSEQSEAVMDVLEERFAEVDGFRLMLFPIEATLPQVTDAEERMQNAQERTDGDAKPTPGRISQEELYNDVGDGARITRTYLITVALASVVAAIGLARGSVAMIIGAMVIAPLLGPNVGLAMGVTLGDLKLVKRSLFAGVLGIAISLVVALGFGIIFKPSPMIQEIATRTSVRLTDVVLALAAGSAAVLATTSGVSAALIGVMVAVALLPPLVAVGLLAGQGYWSLAFGAMLLSLSNIVSINLAGIVTFLLSGIRPRTWWEADRAKKAVGLAMALWVLVLGALIALIMLARTTDFFG